MSKSRLEQMAAFQARLQASKKNTAVRPSSDLSANDTSASTDVSSNGNLNLFGQIEELNKKFDEQNQKIKDLEQKNQDLTETLKAVQKASSIQDQQTKKLIEAERTRIEELSKDNQALAASLNAAKEESNAQNQATQNLIKVEQEKIAQVATKNKSLEEALTQVSSDSDAKIAQIAQQTADNLKKHTTSLTTAFEEYKKEIGGQIQEVGNEFEQKVTNIQTSVEQLETEIQTTSKENQQKFEYLFQTALQGDLEQISSQTLITELRDKLSEMGLELDDVNTPSSLVFKCLKLMEAQEQIKEMGGLENLGTRINTQISEITKELGGQEVLEDYLSILNAPEDPGLELEVTGDSE